MGTLHTHTGQFLSSFLKHFTVLYIEDFQQKVFYGVMEGVLLSSPAIQIIIMDHTTLLAQKTPEIKAP